MEFPGFNLLPAYNRRVSSSIEELNLVGKVLVKAHLPELLPKCRELDVELHDSIEPGISMVRAHGNWTDAYFHEIATPAGFPGQPLDSICPEGLFKVTASCIDRRCPGMGSHYGFIGIFISMLVSVTESKIWDARCESAT